MSGASFKFDKAVLEDILSRLDLGAYIGRVVSLRSSGSSLQGKCPFHQGKSAALKVFPSTQRFKCFNDGCGVGGDAFRFLMLHQGITFPEAVKELADEVGIELHEREFSPKELEEKKLVMRIHEALAAAVDLFEEARLKMPAGEEARAYLTQREMRPETLKEARVGYALDQWNALEGALQERGFTSEELIAAGLVRKREGRDGHYDFFRNRVMFPIRDSRHGKVIGFGGRALEANARAKYINSATTKVYDKSQVLYGLYDARQAIQRKKRVIVVEGYFDVLGLRQGGFQEAVAACGTALRPEHLRLIMPPRGSTSREERHFYLVFDSDRAGDDRAAKLMPQFFQEGLKAWRVVMPEDCKDPDELILKHGPEAMENALAEARPLVEWTLEYRLGLHDLDTVMGRRGALKDIAPLLALVRDQRTNTTVAERLGLELDEVKTVVANHQEHAPRPLPIGPPPMEAPRPEAYKPVAVITHMLWLLTHRLDEVKPLTSGCARMLGETHAPVHPILRRLLAGEDPRAVVDDLPSPILTRLLDRVVHLEQLYEPEQAVKAWADILARLTRPARERDIATLLRQSNAHEDPKIQQQLTQRWDALSKENRRFSELMQNSKYSEAVSLLEKWFSTERELT